jgi:hypothetical protein
MKDQARKRHKGKLGRVFILHPSSFILPPSAFIFSYSATNELGKRNGNVTKTLVQHAANERGPCHVVRFAQIQSFAC